MKAGASATVSLWVLWIVCGLPVLATPVLLMGGLFAFLAKGITPIQQLHVVAAVAYPVVAVIACVMSVAALRTGDVDGAVRTMLYALGYLVAVIALYPLIGFK